MGGVEKTATTPDVTEGYVLKLRADGSFEFVRTFPGGRSSVWTATAMRDGSILVAGSFTGPVDFGRGAQDNGVDGSYLAKLSSTGTLIWVKSFKGAWLNAVGEGDRGGALGAGYFTGTMTLEPNGKMTSLVGGDGWGLVVVQVNGDGTLTSAGSLALHATEVMPVDVLKADDGAIYTVGRFANGTFPLGPHADSRSKQAAAETDAFVAKFSDAGRYLWGDTFGGTAADYGHEGLLTPSGGILAAGVFRGTSVDFGTQDAPDMRSSESGISVFVTELSKDGARRGTFTMGPNAGVLRLQGTEKGFMLAGVFTGTVDLDPTAGTDLKTASSQAGFLANFEF